MRIGVPREIKSDEQRVGLTPESVRALAERGHHVLVERDAGRGIGAGDADYTGAGATIASDAAEIWATADLVVKVKEPLAAERRQMRAAQTLFTYLHLARDEAQARDLLESGATCIAYETVTDAAGRLPLLAPMSEIAGRMAVLVGAHHLQSAYGGRGVLLAGATGVAPARVVILGAGVAGSNAARVALGVGADVTVLDRDARVLERLEATCGAGLRGVVASPAAIAQHLAGADLVVGAVLIPGAAAPRLIERRHLRSLPPGAVLVDIAIDQGGCCETSRPTTHHDPVYLVDGIIHYCVANMPGAVPRTSTFALNHATLPHVLTLADQGVRAALARDAHLRAGLNVHAGRITHPGVADALGMPACDPLVAIR
jgi:alanine dehydrogenase